MYHYVVCNNNLLGITKCEFNYYLWWWWCVCGGGVFVVAVVVCLCVGCGGGVWGVVYI